MIPTIPVALTAAPATAAIATTGLEPLLWVIIGLMAVTVALIFREARSGNGAARGLTLDDLESRVRLQIVPKLAKPALDAA